MDGLYGVYPWPWPIVDALYHSLNSYLGHFRKAASYRLIERLRQRFPWLDEYYLTGMSERVLVCRWPGVAELSLLEGKAATSR